MIAFHFPPVAMSSGHLRTLGFVRHLPELGWEPVVLSANRAAFPCSDIANNQLIPENCRVHRAFALDTRRHLGIAGKYPGILAQPDRWISWWPAAVWQGMRLIRRHRIRAIWSTYPIMTAHCIADSLSRMAGLPWVADFRDPVASSASAANKFAVSAQRRCEERVLNRATKVVFTTPSAMQDYATRYTSAFRDRRLAVIPNGYDESAYSSFPAGSRRQPGRPLRLVHSGLLYPDGRNPVPFFNALARLKSAGIFSEDDLEIVLRASGSEDLYAEEIRRLGLARMITLAPPITNREALIEQANADALLLFQGAMFDRQIPAKAYEYLRIGHPIFAMVGENGDTAALLRETGGAELAPLDDISLIETRFREFIQALREGRSPKVDEAVVRGYSRRRGAVSLAGLLDGIVRTDYL